MRLQGYQLAAACPAASVPLYIVRFQVEVNNRIREHLFRIEQSGVEVQGGRGAYN